MPDVAAEETRGRVRLPAVTRSPVWELSRRRPAGGGDPRLHGRCWSTSTGPATATTPTRRTHVDLVDSIYYTTVTLSTTGYGDIAPVPPHTRLINAFVLTPLRIGFLVLLIGTTLEVLATQGREMFRISRWRKTMDDHVIVIGYGTKGRSAVETLRQQRRRRRSRSSWSTRAAPRSGRRTPTGSPSSPATPPAARCCAGPASAQAKQVIITTDRDDSTVLATLNVRQLNPDTYVVAAVRESDNVQLVRQSGADSVVTSSDAVGRLLGLSSLSPTLGRGDGGPADLRRGPRGRRARPAGAGGRQAAPVAARPGDRGRPRRGRCTATSTRR